MTYNGAFRKEGRTIHIFIKGFKSEGTTTFYFYLISEKDVLSFKKVSMLPTNTYFIKHADVRYHISVTSFTWLKTGLRSKRTHEFAINAHTCKIPVKVWNWMISLKCSIAQKAFLLESNLRESEI